MNGITLRPDLIKAIVESSPDREWQTRRVMREQSLAPDASVTSYDESGHVHIGTSVFQSLVVERPHYQVGEVVYVKETHYRYGRWVKNGLTKTGKQRWGFKGLPEMITTRLGGDSLRYCDNPPDEVKPNSYRKEAWYKRSALFMPEWTARYFIKFTGVGAGRVQEISELDVFTEGFKNRILSSMNPDFLMAIEPAKREFIRQWNSINPKYPWESNPWIFLYSFKRYGHSSENG